TDITESKLVEQELITQKQLFESLVTVARATAEGPEIEHVLQSAVYVAATLTGAELGSLLLLDESQRITHSYLSGRQNGFGPHKYRLRTVMERGLAHWVVENSQSALIHDTRGDKRWISLPNDSKPARSALAVPINSGENTVGVLTLQHSRPGHFRLDYLSLIEAAADQIALALRNAQMYEAQHRLADHQSILYEVLRTISLHLDPETVVQEATEAIAKLAKWTAVAILVYDEELSLFSVQSATGNLRSYMGEHVSVKDGVSGRAFAENQTQVVSNLQADPAYEGVENFHSAISIPLRRGDRRIGVFHVESDKIDAFSADDVQLAEALAEAIGLAMENARTHVELRDYAAGLSTLYTVTRQLSSTLIVGDVLEKTLYAALTALEFERGLITLRSQEDDILRVQASYGFEATALAALNQQGLLGTACEYVHMMQDPLHIADTKRDGADLRALHPELTAVLDDLEANQARSYSGIPLMHRGESIGTVCLFASRPRSLSLEEVSLQMTIGQQIATALANAELYDQTRHQLREQTAIREAVSMISSSISFSDVLALIVEQMCVVLDATSAYICSFDNETLYSTVLAEFASEFASEAEKVSDLGETYYMPEEFPQDLQLLKVGWPTIIHADDPALNISEAEHMQSYGAKSLLIVPMQFRDKTVAYAEIWESRHHREFSPDEVVLAQSIAQQAAIAFENARLFSSVEDERSQLQALIQASRDGIVLIGTGGELKVINQTALVLLGLSGTISDWKQRSFRQMMDGVPAQASDVMWLETSRLQREGYLMSNGEVELTDRIVQWLTVPVQAEESQLGQLLILRDVTNERLLARMREDLVHTIVHDLRNPLSAVNICVEMMAEQIEGHEELGSEMRQYFGIVQRNTDKTTRLVDTILDISRLESGQMPLNFRPVLLHELVEDVLQLQKPLAAEDGIRLENVIPLSLPRVLIDASLIERVLQNLIDNALKTAPMGRGVIRVEAVMSSTTKGRRVLISVADNGPGIAPSIRDHMFKKFTTGQGQKRRGTGLGLAFCRMVIDAHEEDIWVASSSRESGTIITFSLPLAL
ncbi:MAG: GAF domain-containing protein, partial [Chloroflexota bacterium]